MYMRTVTSRNAIIKRKTRWTREFSARKERLPVLVQKADHTRPTRFCVTRLVLHAGLCDLACVIVSSDGDDSAKTLALSLQSFLHKALRSMLRDPSFYGVIMHVFSELLQLCRGKALNEVIKCWRRRWRGRGRGGGKMPCLCRASSLGRSSSTSQPALRWNMSKSRSPLLEWFTNK